MAADRIEATIVVTQDHIDRGERCDNGSCPIALAMLDSIPGAEEAHAMACGLLVRVGNRGYKCDTPDVAYRFMRAFDDGQPVQPFEFPVAMDHQDGLWGGRE